MKNLTRTWPILLLCIVIPEGVGMLSTLFSGDVTGKYLAFVKPPLSPPNWLFGIVWPVLYLLMGLALFFIFCSSAEPAVKRNAYMLFVAQLLLNFLWSIVFFGQSQLWVAAIVLVILDILVFLCISAFWKIDSVAGICLVPYMAWISFATYLNIAFAILN